MKNKQIIKALTIGISANMILNPVVAFAEDLSEDDLKDTMDAGASENAVIKSVEDEESIDTPTYENTKQEITDAAIELATVSIKVENADQVEGTDYKETEEAIDKASDKLRGAAEDVQTASDNLSKEMSNDVQVIASAKLAEDDIADAEKAFSESEEAASDAVKKDESISVDTSSANDATAAIQTIENDLKIAGDKLKEAENKLSTARSSLETASKEYEALMADKNASDKALADAKGKVSEAESSLLEAQENVEKNAKITEELERDANKLGAYNQIYKLKEELASMSSSDEKYSEIVNTLSELIIKYYLIDKVDDSSAVDITDASEKYIIGYEYDSEGNPQPVYKDIRYKNVIFTVEGEEVTRKINYNCDDEGVITISEKNISAEESEISVLPKREMVLTDENGNTFTESATSHLIYKNSEDVDEGFYAIDTASSEVISEKDLLPSEGSSATIKDLNNNTVYINYKRIVPIENADTSISYELAGNDIAEIKSVQYEVEYSSKTEYTKTVSGFTRRSEAEKAADLLIKELEDQYGDSFESEGYQYTPESFTLLYTIKENKSEIMYLPVSRTVFKAGEFIDRSPAPIFVDEDGNEYEANDWMISVYFDSKNKDLGLYASDVDYQRLQEEYLSTEGNNYVIYERDEQGRPQKTYIEYVNRLSGKETRTRETFLITDYYDNEVTLRELAEGESIYDILNEYQKRGKVTVTLKGKDSSSYDYVVDYSASNWFDDAEKEYLRISESAGGCVIEVTEAIPITHEVTGIALKNYEGYRVLTEVSVVDTKIGNCATEEEAQKAIDDILDEAYDTSYGTWVKEQRIDEVKDQEGNTSWEYKVEYVMYTHRGYSIKDELAYRAYYDCTKYMNPQAKTEKIYSISETDNVLLKSSDATFSSVIWDRNKAFNKAIEAKAAVVEATNSYKAALDSVNRAKKAVEALEAAAVPQTILDEATAKYNAAQTNLKNALKHKENAEIALETAKESLSSAEKKLEQINAKQASNEQDNTFNLGIIADAGTIITPADDDSVATTAVQPLSGAQASMIQVNSNANQSQESVLGAVRISEAKVVNVSNANKKTEIEVETSKAHKENTDTSSLNAGNTNEAKSSNESFTSDEATSEVNTGAKQTSKTINDEKTAHTDKPVASQKTPTTIFVAIIAAGVIAASWFAFRFLRIRIR